VFVAGALVMLVEPSGRLVSAVARGGRWRARLVAVGTFLAMALTALGALALVARATGWAAPMTSGIVGLVDAVTTIV
jgi:hypothetical protein